ncbi:MAG: hypothetical protein M1830_001285 [Pleopsidium flavum]|nr:MAG: hypothetical protein M1830_001285 [Pleopsidium flavum]
MPTFRYQALVATTDKSKKQREANKKRCQDQHRRSGKERPENERLLTMNDVDKFSYELVCRRTMIGFAKIIHFFSEFCEDVLHLPKEQPSDTSSPSVLNPIPKRCDDFSSI